MHHEVPVNKMIFLIRSVSGSLLFVVRVHITATMKIVELFYMFVM